MKLLTQSSLLSGSGRVYRHRKAMIKQTVCTATCAVFAVSQAWAQQGPVLPTGAEVVAGHASISKPESNQ